MIKKSIEYQLIVRSPSFWWNPTEAHHNLASSHPLKWTAVVIYLNRNSSPDSTGAPFKNYISSSLLTISKFLYHMLFHVCLEIFSRPHLSVVFFLCFSKSYSSSETKSKSYSSSSSSQVNWRFILFTQILAPSHVFPLSIADARPAALTGSRPSPPSAVHFVLDTRGYEMAPL